MPGAEVSGEPDCDVCGYHASDCRCGGPAARSSSSPPSLHRRRLPRHDDPECVPCGHFAPECVCAGGGRSVPDRGKSW